MMNKERPILFTSEMVLAILEGHKTQTRRVIKPEWSRCLDLEEPVDVMAALFQCPYGHPDERLWVREAFTYVADEFVLHPGVAYRADNKVEWFQTLKEGTTVYNVNKPELWKWRPSIHMPRWASRITLEIVNVRAQRLDQVTPDDLLAEGISLWVTDEDYSEAYEAFSDLWDSINAKRGYSWESNPWVWVIEFKRVTQEKP